MSVSNKRLAAGFAILLLLGACGDSAESGDTGDADAPTTTQATDESQAGDGPPMAPAELSVSAQVSDGVHVVIDSVTLPADGYVVIHADGGAAPGAVIGHSDLLPAGESVDVQIHLDSPLTESGVVFPMAHIDVDGDGVYEFNPPEDTTDGPALTSDGAVAVLPVDIEVDPDLDVHGADEAGDASGAEPLSGSAEIVIAGFSFSGPITVTAGTTVTIVNDDTADHTWTSTTGAFDSGTLGPGETFEFTFDTPGDYEFFCAIHPGMTGMVTVVP